jgi:glucose-6-phosphate dehydrogenase assembly protein OpcA
VTVLNAWSAEDVRVPDVLAALESLRHHERLPATRTAVMTLVVVGRDRAELERAARAVYELGGRHPARTLVVLEELEGDGAVDADVRLMGGEAEGHGVWFEHIDLTVGSASVVWHLDSLIEPFALPDLPVVSWFVDFVPAPDDRLLRATDTVLVDARDLGEVGCFAALADVARKRPVLDLSWIRLRPWRELLAGLFEGPAFRPFLAGVRTASVEGKPGPRALLAGWVADRLELGSSALSVVDAEHASVELRAVDERGRSGSFSVSRPGDERVVVARAVVEGGPSSEAVLPLPPASPAWGLTEALSRLGHDPLYERALRSALAREVH